MRLIEDVVIPANAARAFTLKKGQHIRIIGEGQAHADFVAFNLDNLKERFDQATTKAYQGRIFISTGDRLLSKSNNAMFTIVKDTYEGTHDLQFGMCSKKSYQKEAMGVYEYQHIKELPDRGCWENLTQALKPWNIASEDIPSPFVIFDTVKVDASSGRLEMARMNKPPGTHVEMRAEMDCLVALSACPAAGWGEPIKVEIYQE